jgi:hypothetical protein
MIRSLLLLVLLVSPALAQDSRLTAWRKIYQVFSHPRCANCHVGPDNVPIWSGSSYGPKARPHGMNINAGPSRKGEDSILCNTCHRHYNALEVHGPPGTKKGWLLAPVSMQWFGKTSAEICAQIKDLPASNGDFSSIAKIAEHVRHEPLVQWGWMPGPGREPAPYSADEVADFLMHWNMGPCPTN